MVTHTYYKLRVVDFVAADYKQIGVGGEVKSTLLFFWGDIDNIYCKKIQSKSRLNCGTLSAKVGRSF